VIPTWFLYISGFSLILLGIMQIQARPRARDATLYQRFANVGTVWSLCCIAVGVGLVAMALGYWSPLDQPPPKVPAKHRVR
jgi:hypothetical protein